MTITAFTGRLTVTAWFALRDSTVVAEGTQIESISMRKSTCDISPWCRRYAVTIITEVGGIWMASWLTRRYTSIVTTYTRTEYLAVIKRCN